MEGFEEKAPSMIPGVTHRYLQVNLIRLELVQLDPWDILKLQKKLEDIDRHVSRPNFVEQFLEDIDYQGGYEKALAYHCGIQDLGYEGWKYGFYEDGWDPTLTQTQKMRLEYAGIIIRDTVLKKAEVPLGIQAIAQKHTAYISWLLELPVWFR